MQSQNKHPKETERYMYNAVLQEAIEKQLKQAIKESGFTQVQLLEAINSKRKDNYKYSASNLSTKISSGRITYWEAIEIAEILGYEITWNKKI
ncbi:MAG TPA: hypothetical protein VHP31_03970 [Caproicibacter sp.]|nr:hypothetical protein [Caproicibacter sp.]